MLNKLSSVFLLFVGLFVLFFYFLKLKRIRASLLKLDSCVIFAMQTFRSWGRVE